MTPELADMRRQIEERRRQRQGLLIVSLHERGALQSDLSLEEAIDVLWALTSYDLYGTLVVAQGWEPEQYERWLGQLLIQQLLASS